MIIPAILLGLASAGNLYANLKGIRKLEYITKPLLMLLIGCMYIAGTDNISCLWLAGIVLSLAGDILLMFPKLFVPGGISFGFSHICYTVYLLTKSPDAKARDYLITVSALFVYILISFILFRIIRDGLDRQLRFPYFLYLFVNACTNVSAILVLLTAASWHSVICVSGAVLFYLSDCILFYGMAGKVKNKRNILNVCVMATYIAAQFMLTLGIIL